MGGNKSVLIFITDYWVAETVWHDGRVSTFLIFIAGVYERQRDIFGPMVKKIFPAWHKGLFFVWRECRLLFLFSRVDDSV